MSEEYETLFGETSAADGRNVEKTLWELARLLREREDQDIQKALRLSLDTEDDGRGKKKAKSCCKSN